MIKYNHEKIEKIMNNIKNLTKDISHYISYMDNEVK